MTTDTLTATEALVKELCQIIQHSNEVLLNGVAQGVLTSQDLGGGCFLHYPVTAKGRSILESNAERQEKIVMLRWRLAISRLADTEIERKRLIQEEFRELDRQEENERARVKSGHTAPGAGFDGEGERGKQ